jgi:hypothetical protein
MERPHDNQQISIFCCYARQDQSLVIRLKNHLKIWERQNLITLWTDTDIAPGTNWENAIAHQLDHAHLILFLVSPDFLASDYCYSTEMMHAMKRYETGEVCVLPIILRHCAWEDALFGKIQALPTNAEPVIGSGWHNPDEALADIAKGIRQVVDALVSSRQQKEKTMSSQIATKMNEQAISPLPSSSFHLLHTFEKKSGNNYIRCVAWSPDGAFLASGYYEGTIHLWNATTGKVVHSFAGHKYTIHTLVWSPDSTALASVGGEPFIKIWNARTGTLQSTFKAHLSNFFSRNSGSEYIAWSSDGAALVCASFSDKTIRIRSATTGDVLSTIPCQTKSLCCVAWSPDETRFAGSCEGGTIKIWDARTGDLLHTLIGHTDLVYSIVWSPDNIHLATASFRDKTIKIWNTHTEDLSTLSGYIDGIRCMAWSPDGRLLVSGHEHTTIEYEEDGGIIHIGTEDITIRIWDPIGRVLLQTLNGHGNSVEALVWSPDGTCFASGSNDGFIKLWSSV